MQQILYFLIIFIFGLIVGSFLNCVIYRLEVGQGFFKGRSYCPHCKQTLSWLDLIPVLSFFALRGRCRYCHQKISWQYPLVEIVTGLLFIFIFLRSDILGRSDLLIFWFAIIQFLIVIFVYDLKHYIIPDRVIYPAIGIALVYNFLKSDFLVSTPGVFSSTPGVFWKSDFLISAFGAAGFFLAIVIISRGRWMGVGDIKLAFLMGLVLGWPNIFAALFLAFLIGAIIGIGLIFLGKKTIKSEVPFGPFLVLGTFIALFWGDIIINWYIKFIIV